jgi:tetratricopeptide (TPR) repeat protein
MMQKNTIIFIFTVAIMTTPLTVFAQSCQASDKSCLMDEIDNLAPKIDVQAWRDKTRRELAKAYTHEGQEDKAISLISKISSSDTKALTIRGIGFAAADNKWTDSERYEKLFKNLAAEAEKIDHKPSYSIAYTYIAMAQAFAGDNEGAMATAKSMDDQALRNKAFGETAEIQAENGDIHNALLSIAEIDSLSFRNKAYSTIATIFTKTGDVDNAYKAAQKIDNAYLKTQALQKIVNVGNAEETITE